MQFWIRGESIRGLRIENDKSAACGPTDKTARLRCANRLPCSAVGLEMSVSGRMIWGFAPREVLSLSTGSVSIGSIGGSQRTKRRAGLQSSIRAGGSTRGNLALNVKLFWQPVQQVVE